MRALATILAAAAAAAPPAEPAPAAPPSAATRAAPVPVPVTLGFYVLGVREVDVKAQTFFADLYLWVRYVTASDEQAERVEKLEFMNARIDSFVENDRARVGDERYVVWRASGTFYFQAALRNYPFDTQRLEIVVEHPFLEAADLVWVDDRPSYERGGLPAHLWGVKDDLDIAEFTLRKVERRVLATVHKTDFGDPTRTDPRSTYSRFVLSMHFARDFWPYFFKIIIPLLVIVAMAYLVFWLPPEEIQSASGLAITALLSCIAFNLSVAQNLPEVGYLVVSDKFFITTYVLLFLTLAQSVVTHGWNLQGRRDVALRSDRVSRVVFPVMYLGAFAYLLGFALVSG